MAEEFNNLEANSAVRSKINNHAREINSLTLNKAPLTGGKVPKSYLPDGDLNPIQFVQDETTLVYSIDQTWLNGIIDARIVAAGGNPGQGNTTPAAPGVTANDTADTLAFNHALGNSEIVVSVNGGAYAAYAGTINVGNVDRVAGYWKAKIKAATGRNESAVTNSPAFTSAVVVDDLTPLTSYAQTEYITVAGNTLTYIGTPPNFGYGRATGIVAAGAQFIIQIDGSNLNSAGYIGVGVNQDGGTYNFLAAVSWRKSAEMQGRFLGAANGAAFDDYTNIGYTGTPLGRVRGNGTNIYVEKSFDGGTTWVDVDPSKLILQPNSNLSVKIFFDDANYNKIYNIKTKNVA